MCKRLRTVPGLVHINLAVEFEFYFVGKQQAMEPMTEAERWLLWQRRGQIVMGQRRGKRGRWSHMSCPTSDGFCLPFLEQSDAMVLRVWSLGKNVGIAQELIGNAHSWSLSQILSANQILWFCGPAI